MIHLIDDVIFMVYVEFFEQRDFMKRKVKENKNNIKKEKEFLHYKVAYNE